MPTLRPITLAWVMTRTKATGEGCWQWQGRVSPSGYVPVSHNNRRDYLHRVVAEMAYGPIPEGKVVMHRCDNPACVNPKHLRIGTQADNVRDMFEKGRDGRSVGPDRYARGSRVGTALLDESTVVAIKRELKADRLHREIADEFGVSRSTVSLIAQGKSWKHVA